MHVQHRALRHGDDRAADAEYRAARAEMAAPEAPIGPLDIVATEHLAEVPATALSGRYDRDAGSSGYLQDLAVRDGAAPAVQVVHPRAERTSSTPSSTDGRRHGAGAAGARRSAGDRVAVILPRSASSSRRCWASSQVGAVRAIDVSTPRSAVACRHNPRGLRAGLALASAERRRPRRIGGARSRTCRCGSEAPSPWLRSGGDPASIM